MRKILVVLLLLSIAAPDWAAAQVRRGAFPRHRVVVGTFYGPPYYYAPLYLATNVPRGVYVEKYEDTPSADAGEIYCPALDAHYPDVQECPNGWQRIIRAEESAAEGG